jgi:hypothetical protein
VCDPQRPAWPPCPAHPPRVRDGVALVWRPRAGWPAGRALPARRGARGSAILHCAVHRAAPGRLPERPKGAVCKTVGFAYVGSNPTPATTCGNGPWPGLSRRRGLVFLA